MSAQASSQASRKSFLPLESNPAVFTELIHALGVSEKLVFHDVYSISDPDLLALVPRPVYALVLVTPAFPEHDAAKAAEEQVREEYTGFGEDEPVVWFKQTIHNACGLYAILHAICNGVPRSYIGPGSVIDRLLQKAIPLAYRDRAKVVEDSAELEAIHTKMAQKGDTAVPESAEDEVNHHYIGLVKSRSGQLYEMDGDRKGPVNMGADLGDEDLLGEIALGVVKKFIEREEGRNIGFNLMALVADVQGSL